MLRSTTLLPYYSIACIYTFFWYAAGLSGSAALYYHLAAMDTHGVHWLAFDCSATYRICVSGLLGAHWSDQLMGMAIRTVQREGEPPTTVLEGELVDQAALIGVVLALYELHMPMISVECTSARAKHC
jgi:hypothetical protein